MLLYIMLLCYKSYQTIAGSMAQDNIQYTNIKYTTKNQNINTILKKCKISAQNKEPQAPNRRQTLSFPPANAIVQAASTASRCSSAQTIARLIVALPSLTRFAFVTVETNRPCNRGCDLRPPQATDEAILISAWEIPAIWPLERQAINFMLSSVCSFVRFDTVKATTSMHGCTRPATKSCIAGANLSFPMWANEARTNF